MNYTFARGIHWKVLQHQFGLALQKGSAAVEKESWMTASPAMEINSHWNWHKAVLWTVHIDLEASTKSNTEMFPWSLDAQSTNSRVCIAKFGHLDTAAPVLGHFDSGHWWVDAKSHLHPLFLVLSQTSVGELRGWSKPLLENFRQACPGFDHVGQWQNEWSKSGLVIVQQAFESFGAQCASKTLRGIDVGACSRCVFGSVATCLCRKAVRLHTKDIVVPGNVLSSAHSPWLTPYFLKFRHPQVQSELWSLRQKISSGKIRVVKKEVGKVFATNRITINCTKFSFSLLSSRRKISYAEWTVVVIGCKHKNTSCVSHPGESFTTLHSAPGVEWGERMVWWPGSAATVGRSKSKFWNFARQGEASANRVKNQISVTK